MDQPLHERCIARQRGIGARADHRGIVIARLTPDKPAHLSNRIVHFAIAIARAWRGIGHGGQCGAALLLQQWTQFAQIARQLGRNLPPGGSGRDHRRAWVKPCDLLRQPRPWIGGQGLVGPRAMTKAIKGNCNSRHTSSSVRDKSYATAL